jgi:hypothetical protein
MSDNYAVRIVSGTIDIKSKEISTGLHISQGVPSTPTGVPVTFGAGNVEASTPRMTLAADDPAVAALLAISGGGHTDDAAFTFTTGKVQMAGFVFNNVTPDTLNEGDGGAARVSANRNQLVQLRDGNGNERGAAVDASSRLEVTVSTAATTIAKAHDDAASAGHVGVPLLAVRKATPADMSTTDQDYDFLQVKNGRLWGSVLIDTPLPTGTNLIGEVRTRFFAAAASAMTRPANTTAYAANDAVSNNGTAGSVTAISFTVSDANDDPVSLERMRVMSTDTGLSGVTFRAWLFNSDPTANSGVGGGDNAAFSQKQAGFIGTMSGTFLAFSDGYGALLVPDAGARIVANPVSGAQTVFALLQTLTGFTPSANSTTFTCALEGFQGRA